MSQKNKQEKEINLRDFTWEEEEFNFEPKPNRHKKFLKAKRRQLEKEKYVDNKRKFTDQLILDEHKRYMSKIEESLNQDYELIFVDDGSSDTYAYTGHESEFSFNPSTSTPLTVDYDDVEIMYGGQSCFIPIEVSIPLELTAITLSGDYQTSFVEGDEFVFGGIVTAHYSNLSTKDVTSEATFDYDLTEVGEQTVIVNYGGLTKNYDIVVTAGTLFSISVSEMTIKFVKNSPFVFDGICTAVFENGYEKEVTPTSVSSPDMSTAGVKEVTVIYSYNGVSKSTSYEIIVNSYRQVYEKVESKIGDITYTSDKEVISVDTLSTAALGSYSSIDTQYHAWRLGASGKTGTLTVKSTTSNITRIVVNARYYSSDSGTTFTIDGTSKTLTNTYTNYEKAFDSPKNSIAISSVTNGKRVLIAYIVVYTATVEDIGQTEDCIGLESFITEYMHMGYVDNLGYCKDSEHHYYQTAREEFNKLNDHQRELFTSNEAYLAEWNRLQAWASFNGDNLDLTTNELVNVDSGLGYDTQSNTVYIIVIIASMSSISLATLLIIRKRKRK